MPKETYENVHPMPSLSFRFLQALEIYVAKKEYIFKKYIFQKINSVVIKNYYKIIRLFYLESISHISYGFDNIRWK